MLMFRRDPRGGWPNHRRPYILLWYFRARSPLEQSTLIKIRAPWVQKDLYCWNPTGAMDSLINTYMMGAHYVLGIALVVRTSATPFRTSAPSSVKWCSWETSCSIIEIIRSMCKASETIPSSWLTFHEGEKEEKWETRLTGKLRSYC
jgi:hypothetical protein